MSQAAEQMRQYLEAKYPGIRISRKSCRDTASGFVSQHSSYYYGSYDSNALDIMGPSLALGLSYRETQEWLDIVYADIWAHKTAWSIWALLWRVPDHYGHIHADFAPRCLEPRWCGRRIVPRWKYSDGETFTAEDPAPENGEYHGPTPPPTPEPEPEPEEDNMPDLATFTKYIRKTDIDKMAADGIITEGEAEYFTGPQMWIDDDKKRDLEHPDWENLYNAYRVRAPIWAV